MPSRWGFVVSPLGAGGTDETCVVDCQGQRPHHRIRWTSLGGSPPRVRQLWESSTDGGKTWAVAFDGTYQKRQ